MATSAVDCIKMTEAVEQEDDAVSMVSALSETDDVGGDVASEVQNKSSKLSNIRCVPGVVVSSRVGSVTKGKYLKELSPDIVPVVDTTIGPAPHQPSQCDSVSQLSDLPLVLKQKLSPDQLGALTELKRMLSEIPIVDSRDIVTDSSQIFQSKWLFRTTQEAPVKEMTLDDIVWCTDLVCHRYLRSYEWNAETAFDKICRSLCWRRFRKPQTISPSEVESHMSAGKMYRKGFDIDGNPIIYIRPHLELTAEIQELSGGVVYVLERALGSCRMSEGKDQVTFLLDFNGWKTKDAIGLDVVAEMVHVLNDHYTDSLIASYIVDAPTMFQQIWHIVKLMVHDKTAKKVHFVDSSTPEGIALLLQRVPMEYLETHLGGACTPPSYCHATYWASEEQQFLQSRMFDARVKRMYEASPEYIARVALVPTAPRPN